MAHDAPLDLPSLRVALQREGAPWRAADTGLAMLGESDRARLLGVPLRDVTQAAQIVARAAAATGHAAGGGDASFDARNAGGASYVTAVKHQLTCGSSVAFATLATIETTAAFTRADPGLRLDLSEQHLFFVLGPATGASCADGWWPEHAFAACTEHGVTFEDCMPYEAGGGGTLNADWPNRLARVTAFRTLTGDVAAMKQHIQAHGAVSACLVVFEDFFGYGGGVYRHVIGAPAGGHCVCLVGFDDAQRCWIAKNSWGGGWGEQGFFRIRYGECGIEAWAVHGAESVNLSTRT